MNIQKIKINNVSHTQPIKVNNAQSIVFNMKTQEKVVIPTKETQHINPDIGYNALSKVIVEPIPVNYIQPTETKKINSNGIHNIKEYANVEVDVQPSLQDKTVIVKPSDNIYIMPDEDYYGLAVVNVVGAVDTENVEITPTKEVQTITRSEYKYIENVKVNAIPDEYIIPSGELEITENGNYDVTDKASVKVETSGVDINNYFDTYYDGTTPSSWVRDNFILKMPDLVIDDSVTSLTYFCAYVDHAPKIICNDNVTSVESLFREANYLTSVDLSGINTSSLQYCTNMFYNCYYINNIDMSNWDFSNIKSFEGMFYNCRQLTNVKFGKNIKNIESCTNMFYSCRLFSEVNLNDWDTSSLKSIGSMFYSSGLVKLDISEWDGSSLDIIGNCFYGCASLREVKFMKNLGKGYTRNTTNYSNYTLRFSSHNLTYESLMSVINNLYDLNLTYDVANGGTLHTQQLIIGATNIAKLTEEEMAIATAKGWTIS